MQQSEWPQLEGLLCEQLPGHASWLVAVKAYGLRLGPHAWPLPGMGCWIQLQPPSAPCSRESFLLLLPVKGILGEGVSLKDCTSFLETVAGATSPRLPASPSGLPNMGLEPHAAFGAAAKGGGVAPDLPGRGAFAEGCLDPPR